ncbi:bile acid:sodium symporter [Natronolimnohabitans sp. A-GB9]|uniref:bile acid:sodium symporter family protein n=1 Tax=Natronolimnohabitans sp. A-GB9 TaxID=3069757 RepID=UPI0027B65CE5|nr:bile acid:sodium symporter [Natronolimnohabitans sp. A-GB9]MDQ2051940.1 bile acid:sodium symporter [Natronolimnohabitans sp. A-GB9]
MDRIWNALRSQRSLLVVVAATLAGVAYPDLAAPLQPIIPALVAGLIFTAFYGFSFGELTSQNLSVPVVVSLACLYLVVPVALYPVASIVLSGEVLLGVLIVLSAPVAAGSSIIWTRLGGGNTLLATVIVLVSMVLAPVVMPSLIAFFGDSGVDIAASDLVVELAAIIAVAGVFAYLVPDGTVSDGQLDGFSIAAIGALIYAGVGGSTLSVSPFDLAFVGAIAIAALCLSAGLAYALHVHGLRNDDCITVLFSSSMKNMSVSVMVGAVFGGGAVIASITAFHVAQQVVSSSLVQHLDSISPTQSSEAVTPTQSSETITTEQLGD